MYFLGVDLAGEVHTWAVALDRKDLSVKEWQPGLLKELVAFCEDHPILGAAIDAPLTFGLSDRKGFREIDQKLRALLPKEARNWVVSYHGLQAVPIRGKILAEALSPLVGTILETHPRSSLYFLLPEGEKYLAFQYKRRRGEFLKSGKAACKKILDHLKNRFGIEISTPEKEITDGLIDALLCALTVYLFHTAPEKLLFLSEKGQGVFGRGPFVVIREP